MTTTNARIAVIQAGATNIADMSQVSGDPDLDARLIGAEECHQDDELLEELAATD